MAKPIERIKVWFDKEGDFLEVMFSDDAGYMVETDTEEVMRRIDAEGNVIGFSVMNISRFDKTRPVTAALSPRR